MDTVNVLLERELLIKKLEYAKQKLFDIGTDLSQENKANNNIADEAYRAIDVLEDKNKIW